MAALEALLGVREMLYLFRIRRIVDGEVAEERTIVAPDVAVAVHRTQLFWPDVLVEYERLRPYMLAPKDYTNS